MDTTPGVEMKGLKKEESKEREGQLLEGRGDKRWRDRGELTTALKEGGWETNSLRKMREFASQNSNGLSL